MQREMTTEEMKARIAELEAKNNGLLDQHARDSKELRALCEQRDEYLVTSRRLQADKRALLQGHEEQASEIIRLRAEVEKYRAGADRWEWRKENPTARLVFAEGFWRVENWTKWHPSADAAVDAAIATRKGEGSQP